MLQLWALKKVLEKDSLSAGCGMNWAEGCYHPFCKLWVCTCMHMHITGQSEQTQCLLGRMEYGQIAIRHKWKYQPRKHWLLQMPLSSPSLSLSFHLTSRPEGFVSSAVWFAPRGDLVCSPQCSIYGLRFSSRPCAAPEQRAICLPRANKQEKNSAAVMRSWGPAALLSRQ